MQILTRLQTSVNVLGVIDFLSYGLAAAVIPFLCLISFGWLLKDSLPFSLQMLFSVSVMMMISTLNFMFGGPKYLVIAIFFFGIVRRILRVRWAELRALIFSAEALSLLLFATLVSVVSNTLQLRFHVNPDVYGQLTAVGAVLDGQSLNDIRNDFKSITGLDDPDWSGKTPNLDWVWGISDSRLRFASDWMIGSGRYGLTTFIAFISETFGFSALATYAAVVFGVGTFASWLAAAISIDLIFKFSGVREKRTVLCSRNLQLLRVCSCILLALAPMTLIPLFSGSHTQVFFTAITLGVWLSVVIWDEKDERAENSQLRLFIIVGVMTVTALWVYPFGVILLLVAMSIWSLMVTLLEGGVHWWRRLAVRLIGVALPLAVVIFDPFTVKSTVLSSFKFSSGSAGGATHLGLVDPLSLLPLGFKRYALQSGGFVKSMPNENVSKIQILMITSFLLILIVLLIVRQTRSRTRYRPQNRGMTLVNSFPFMLIPLASAAALSRFRIGIDNDYMWYRNVATILTFSIPLVGGVLLRLVLTSRETFRWGCSPIISAVAVLAVPLQIHAAREFAKSYRDTASVLIPFDTCPRDLGDSMLVSTEPDIRILSLALCGPVYNLTDDWAPEFPEGRKWKVAEVQNTSTPYKVRSVGEIHLREPLKGPCNSSCLSRSFSNLVFAD